MQTLIAHSKINRPLRRTAALLCAALAGLCLAGRAAAQVVGPLATSPPQPTPFQSPLYHSGGASTPYPVTAATAAPYLTPLLDPLQSQAQGTPTELYNGALTQIPSFLLGNYDPTRPPTGLAGGVNVYYPNHFADGDIYAWSAPFSYAAQNAGTVTADDASNTIPPTFTAGVASTSGFVGTGGFAVGGALINTVATNPSAGTATGLEYLRLASGVPGQAVWTLYEPTAGTYSLYFHIPNDLPDSTGNVETRDTQVAYVITVRDAGGAIAATTTATASQTEANDTQFLAGPLQVASGGSITVTLTRNNTTNNNADYLVADSMTLQQAVGDVQSAPTAITYDLFPNEFSSTTHPLQYWGVYVPTGTTVNGAPTGGTTALQVIANANPDTTTAAVNPAGTNAINGGNVLLKTGSSTDPLRRIRQLVYFGRSEPSINRTSTIDDSQAGFTGPGGTPGADAAANATATNGEYLTYPAVTNTTPTTLVATWTVPAPTSGGTASSFVYAHIPATPAGETRQSSVFYTVSVNGGPAVLVRISQVTGGTAASVLLPTGPLAPAAGSSIVVSMYADNGQAAPFVATGVVVADSITVTTATGQGAIYCVDGFNGQVVWRYETPGSANGASAPVFASPAIAKINVLVTPAAGATPAVYANKLVVIVGDNGGLVYCLDAIGNGDGTSNVNVLAKDANGNPIPNQPITIPQPPYGTTPAPVVAGTLAATAALTAHVGTTGVYWIYRPDASRPKYIAGTNLGKVKSVDPTTDVPVPAAFNTASPTIFVDPTVFADPTGAPTPYTALTPVKANAIVYIGNSNGVLYALNASGGAADGSSIDDPYNVSQNLGTTYTGLPSAQPLWWFSLRGPDPNSASNASSADIESAPSLYVKVTGTAPNQKYTPTVYSGSAHEMETTSNVGRLYALNGIYGPSGNNGRSSSLTTVPGSFNYNVGQRPQTSKTDTADWSFPDAVGSDTYSTGKSSSGKPRPALGNITGSPVVFTNTHETVNNPTRIYIAANTGQEYPAAARPDDTTTGRLWAVNLDGSVGTTTGKTTGTWAYPLANDPNNAALDGTAEPYPAIGSFLRATPAIGFVQFPATIINGDSSIYNPADAFNTAGIDGNVVPMLYVATRGVNDTSLYALDIDGAMTGPSTSSTAINQRIIYRIVSPNGSIFQSSPALVTNASNNGYAGANGIVVPGNGGAVYAVAGNSLYDYSATPISNPFAGQAYPLIRQDRNFTGFGPISSPALAGANVTDLPSATIFIGTAPGTTGLTNNNGFTKLTTDWVYVGDSSSGFCKAITPNDSSYGGIPTELGQIIPYDPTAPLTPLMDAFIQSFLVPTQPSTASTDSKPFGVSAPLPVYEWGESAYFRFTNVAPPNSGNLPALFVYDHRKYDAAALAGASAANPIPFYTSDGTTAQTVTFNLSDADTTTSGTLQLDNGSVQPQLINTPPDGFVKDGAGTPPSFFPDVVTNLVANNGSRYLGTYTYTIADGTARNNTPGARRRLENVKQVVTEWDFTNSLADGDTNNIANYVQKGTTVIGGDATNENLVSQKIVDPVTGAITYGFNANSKIAAIDQPTFGILNPLGVRGGGVSLLLPSTAVQNAVAGGDELGPFRSVTSPPTLNTVSGTTSTTPGDNFALQSLANGNDIPQAAPPSSSGVGGSPIVQPNVANGTDPTGVNTPTTTSVVFTSTGLIPHNNSGSNAEASTVTVTGVSTGSTSDGLNTTLFGGSALDVFDRGALFNLGQTLRLKMGVATPNLFAPQSSRDGLYWNSNATNPANGGSDVTGHDAVVNFLPWEIPPTPYAVSGTANGSQDYPDIAPGNINASTLGSDLTSNNVTLTSGMAGTGTARVTGRTVTGDPVRIQVNVTRYQPANQQLYQQPTSAGQVYQDPPTATSPAYAAGGQIAPVQINPSTGAATPQIATSNEDVFPMGYVTVKRLYVPTATGFYSPQRPYRDVRIYTGVPVDMHTSVINPVTDIGKVPAAFGVQTESDPNYNLFTPYNTVFQNYFKPLEIHNDGNVNLLNIHLDQKYVFASGGGRTLLLNSDAVDPLSFLGGYDIPPTGAAAGVTGPRTMMLPSTTIVEQPFLIRSSVDTDLIQGYGRNPYIAATPALSALYPSATFHKPIAGSSQPATLTVPDDPEGYVAGASLPSSPTPVPPSASGYFKSPPFVSLAMPFGTPVGTYSTPSAQQMASLRLFEGIDLPTQANSGTVYSISPTGLGFLYPPQYSGAVGGIGKPGGAPTDVYTVGLQPISTSGTQLTGTVLEQRLTDGATYGAVPMIDNAPTGGTPAAPLSSPDFAPAAFRDPTTGNLSVYWTSGRSGTSYGIYGANLPFTPDPAGNTTGLGYFLPQMPTGQWWQPFSPAVQGGAVNSGLSIVSGPTPNVAFDVAVSSTAPYSNTLYSYTVVPGTGALSAPLPITADPSQVKYGIKGIGTGFTNPLWAFWTASTRGRTAIYYNSLGSNGTWVPTAPAAPTVTLLPVPAGLTAVADASPMLMTAPVAAANGTTAPASTIEVTYSGTAPDGNVDLYASRYVPHGTTAPASSQLDLVAFPAVTENLRAVGGWYQSRDVAWSRAGALNVLLSYRDANGLQTPSLLYNAATNVPKFTKAIYDKASGLLVLTGVKVPIIISAAGAAQTYTTNTVYIDAATGRIRFSPALLPATQSFTRIEATFSPLARRLTVDSRADTAPVTFLDDALKVNDAPGLTPVVADRRWTVWRKAGVNGVTGSATLYYKTQRLTYFLPSAIGLTNPPLPAKPVLLTPFVVKVNGTDVTSQVDVDFARGRIYFPISTGAEGQSSITVQYVPANTVSTANPAGTPTTTTVDPLNTVEWQDEILANNNDVPPIDSAAGLDTVLDNGVPIDTAVNENNVTAFLDPFAYKNTYTSAAVNDMTHPHKVWLFWNSTRNGTADIYSETIDPRFAPAAP